MLSKLKKCNNSWHKITTHIGKPKSKKTMLLTQFYSSKLQWGIQHLQNGAIFSAALTSRHFKGLDCPVTYER